MAFLRDEREMMQKGGLLRPLPPKYRPTLPPELSEALELYNIMGGLDWAAIPVLFDIYGVEDKEQMIVRLALIRDAVNTTRDDGTRRTHTDHSD